MIEFMCIKLSGMRLANSKVKVNAHRFDSDEYCNRTDSEGKRMETEGSFLTISKVSERLKVPKHTLRFWEKEFGRALVPLRTVGGQRRYSSEDLLAIEKIKTLREGGMSLSEIRSGLDMGNRENDSSTRQIDLLADHVPQVVKAEVYNFFGNKK